MWIDYFRGVSTREVEVLDTLLGREPVAIGDIILTEVLQGFTRDGDFERALLALAPLTLVQIVDSQIAVQAARHYRLLRTRGVTARKTIDTLIATRCLQDGLALLYSDRDFDPFVAHLGLVSASQAA